MFKNKVVVLFVLLLVGFFYLGNMNPNDSKKLDYEEVENIEIIYE